MGLLGAHVGLYIHTNETQDGMWAQNNVRLVPALFH